jgi:hypothetical protein
MNPKHELGLVTLAMLMITIFGAATIITIGHGEKAKS